MVYRVLNLIYYLNFILMKTAKGKFCFTFNYYEYKSKYIFNLALPEMCIMKL